MNEAYVNIHTAIHLSQTTVLSDESIFQMHTPVWLAGYAGLAVLEYLSTACGARHYAQLNERAQVPSK